MINIAVIDSGISAFLADRIPIIARYTIIENKDRSIALVQDEATDLIGHGTAVASLIASHLSGETVLTIIKIFNESMEVDEEIYLYALEYCINRLSVNIIHMSNGLTCCSDLFRIKSLCKTAADKNIIIVAAFDNFGAISYPAALPNVIGVDVTDENIALNEYIYVERADINILVRNNSIRVPWCHNKHIVCNGTSFNVCRITTLLANLMASGKMNNVSLTAALCSLKSNAAHIHKSNITKKHSARFCMPQKAVLFPVNKEMHALIRFHHLLELEIVGVYDSKYRGLIGKSPAALLDIHNDETDWLFSPIRSILSLNWDNGFDTFILGHVKELERRTQKNYTNLIIENCLTHKKSLYTFDPIDRYDEMVHIFARQGLNLFHPQIDETDIPDLYNGKLRIIGKPILCVMGTSSRQGKFSLQLILREYFRNRGYSVGQLGTEPSSLLFGFEEVYPVGYESSVRVSGIDGIATINQLMSKIEDKNPDIILAGSQSQTVPQMWGNTSLYVLYQHDFLYGVDPDAVVLCINYFDDIQYISRTIRYLESITLTKVIAIVMFPMNRVFTNGVLTNQMSHLTKEEANEQRDKIQNIFGIPTFILKNRMEELGKLCENYFL